MYSRLYKEKLVWMRTQLGETQADMASLCGDSVSESHYKAWESGEVKRPNRNSLKRLAKAFNCEISDLLFRPGDAPDPRYYAFYYTGKSAHDFSLMPSSRKHKLVAFDVDGVLLKNLNFSWQLIWEHLGDNGKLRKRGVRLFDSGSFSYQDWCNYCCKNFRDLGLKEEDFKEITSTVKLVKGFYETIEELKGYGIKLGIISGGVDTFLEYLLPDYKEIFEFVFINRINFDSKGLIKSVDPTPFDFEKKSDGLEMACKMFDIDISHSAFVGDHFNDRTMYKTAGTTIAHQPKSLEIEEFFDHTIYDEDLRTILPVLFPE